MTSDVKAQRASAFVCDMSAIEPGERARHMATIDQLFHVVEAVTEMPDGYTFRLSNDSEVLLRAAEFIVLERLCCPFFGFNLEVEPEGGPLWLSLKGRDGVKPFIAAEIGDHLSESLAKPDSFR